VATCRCTSKAHGHKDRCGKPTSGDADFCADCKNKMDADRRTQEEPKLTPTDTPGGKKFDR